MTSELLVGTIESVRRSEPLGSLPELKEPFEDGSP
jgi:hypothetical protein